MKKFNPLFTGGLAFIFLIGLLFSIILFYEAPPADTDTTRQVESFELPNLHTGEPVHSSQLRLPALINVWASWCVSCRYEHGLLMELQARGVRIYGVNYLDEQAGALDWLSIRGDPYELSLFDKLGSLGVNLGIYGVPETFFINRQGQIEAHHIGILTDEAWQGKFLPLWNNP